MALLSCNHCRYLFETATDVCPACGRKIASDAHPPDERKKTQKIPILKLPIDKLDNKKR